MACVSVPKKVAVADAALSAGDVDFAIELYREATVGMLDVYANMINQRMNDVMKVLTIIATIFIPLSFLTGLFGMNFNESLPGQDNSAAFTYFIVGCLIVVGTMLGVFRWKKWI